MSTRAIITVTNGKETQRLYAHGDGYPSTVGILVYNFSKIAPTIDGNNSKSKVRKAAWGDWSSDDPKKREGRYHLFKGVGQAYSTMYNVSVEPDKFVPALISYMTNKGYGGLYLTNRNPEEEAKTEGTDIEWHYVVKLGDQFGVDPKLETYKAIYNKNSRKSHFVKMSKSIKQLVEIEEAEWKKRQAAYEKEQKAAKEGKIVDEVTADGGLLSAEYAGVKKVKKSARKRSSRTGTAAYIKGLKGMR